MSDMKDAILSGACLTCLDNGTEDYPLDYAYHMAVRGHWPVLSEELYSDTAAWHEENGALQERPTIRQPAPQAKPQAAPREQLGLKEKCLRRIRLHRIAALAFACAAAGIFIPAWLTGTLPWWAGLGGLPFLYLALGNLISAGQIIQAMHSPFFFVAAVRHDLGGDEL